MDSKNIMVLSAKDVAKCIDMPTAIEAMEGAFAQLSSQKARVPIRTNLPIDETNGVCLFMPVYLPENRQVGLKTISLFEDNPKKHGLPMIHAMFQLFDSVTGIPLAVMDGEVLTAIRTGAASGLATRVLSNTDARTAAIIGAGVQGRTQLEAICCVRDIDQAMVYDLSEANASQFAKEMADKLSIPVIPMKGTAELKKADIICTATSSTQALFEHSFLKKGVHINAVGAYRPDMCEIPAKTIAAAKVFVDQREACSSEAGDLIQALNAGIVDGSHISTELGEVILGTKQGRSSKEDITFFKSVGVAVQDLAAASIVYEQAKRQGLGSIVPI